MEAPKFNQEPTHLLSAGARIKVQTKSGRSFALATLRNDIEVAEQPEGIEPHEPAMRLFLSMAAFSAGGFSYHPETVGHYDPGTLLYAYTKKGAGLSRLPKK